MILRVILAQMVLLASVDLGVLAFVPSADDILGPGLKPLRVDESVKVFKDGEVPDFAQTPDLQRDTSASDIMRVFNSPDGDISKIFPDAKSSDDLQQLDQVNRDTIDELIPEIVAQNPGLFGRLGGGGNGDGSRVWDDLPKTAPAITVPSAVQGRNPLIDPDSDPTINQYLYKLNPTLTPAVTRLITNGRTPTLVSNELVRPELRTSKDPNVLARYNLMIPIMVPHVVPDSQHSKRQFTKEIKTKLVPVKKTVDTVRTVLKAEPVRQEVITDYVRTSPNGLPARSDDRLLPGEELLKTVRTETI